MTTYFKTPVWTNLETEINIWLATVRSDGRPHLVPIWFAWYNNKIYFCVSSDSVKAKNIAKNPQVSLALAHSAGVVVCEGHAAVLPIPWEDGIKDIFSKKYNWAVSPDGEYNQLFEVEPKKWLIW